MSSSLAGQSIEAARRHVAAVLKTAGIESADLDARLLVGAALGLDLTALIAAAKRTLTVEEADRLDGLVQRRLAREPVARILGQKEFWSLPLKLSAETLVPRPDTEAVVELALQMLAGTPHPDREWRILDIGTGSGAILLALLSELPGAIGIGSDISLAALLTARCNAVDLALASRAFFVKCNYTAALTGPFDLVVSNPPYIPSQDIAGLDVEVREHDPHLALDGGPDGLDAYRALIPEAVRLLASGGALVVEAGRDQIRDITGLMRGAGLTTTAEPRADLGGVLRAIAGRKLPP
ncbi:peptide chain release factor N(5)-glutamine methyltransferase [Bradyrhizobium sp.]|uniref:peptide chain release factor N(5)-glutamine methyltransferase n=1 Tax=Bradyrhizobium sp. TaxID=376 RepID=UPI0025C3DB3A|nr:peptide chain release factor N(5)-glutamine methyltransferase [Bradyrhizobium sp.]MBV8923720.1 peptide chain release factor N(5)-glutamine methyltransferase [Bradyrhizobium sp.]